MQYAIELYYDPATEQNLFQLAERVAEEKLSRKFLEWKTRPHLTLVLDFSIMINVRKRMAARSNYVRF